MKILICGSRDFDNYSFLETKLNAIFSRFGTEKIVIQGGAKGADQLAELYCKNYQINYICVPAKWNKFGKLAGYQRNIEMINMLSCNDLVVAFQVNDSKGTQHTIDNAKKRNIKTIVFKLKK